MRFAERRTFAVTACLAALLGAMTVRAEDASAVAKTCFACHGERGESSNPLVPILAGQPFTLIEDNLLAFRAGKRSCSPDRADGSPSAALAQTMCALVGPLDDSEIAVLAEYFSDQDFVAAKQSFDPQLAALGSELHDRLGCNRCHASGGRDTLAMAPVLAGQWTPYLRRALKAVHTGLRRGPKMMNPPIVRLDEEQMEALLNFYASQHGTATP